MFTRLYGVLQLFAGNFSKGSILDFSLCVTRLQLLFTVEKVQISLVEVDTEQN